MPEYFQVKIVYEAGASPTDLKDKFEDDVGIRNSGANANPAAADVDSGIWFVSNLVERERAERIVEKYETILQDQFSEEAIDVRGPDNVTEESECPQFTLFVHESDA